HAAAPFFEQVRKYSFINNRNALRCVCHREPHGQSIRIAFDCAFLHESADAKRAIDRRLFRCHLRRTKKEDEIIPKRARDEVSRDRKTPESHRDKSYPLMTSFH